MYPEWAKERSTVSAVILGAAFLAYFLYKRFSKAPIKVPPGAVAVGKVIQLSIFPVKSAVALPNLERVRLVKSGPMTDDNDDIRDRAWMFVNDTGVFLSQRAEPKMALIKPSVPFGGDMLHLDAPGSSTLKVCKYLSSRSEKILDVSVWGHHLKAVDCGQEAADWISAYLGKPGFRMVYLPPDMKGRKVVESPNPADKAFKEDDTVIFSDAAPVLLFSENTIKDVNDRVNNTSVGVRNFRPNILVSGVEAYDEDTWDEIYIGQVKLTNVRGCDRCLMTTVNPDKGEKNANQEPLKTLKGYRPKTGTSPYLGIFGNVIAEGTMKVGDTVYVTRKRA